MEYNNKEKFGFRRLRSSASLIEYFGDDARDEARMAKMNNKFFYHEHTVNFSIEQYLETLVIHILAYVIVGPFINIYTLIFRKTAPNFMHNLQFHITNWKMQSFWTQYLQWAFNIMFYYLFFFTDSKVADYATLGYLIVSYVVRSSSVAGKYATYPKNLYRKIKMKKMSKQEIFGELMLLGWWRQEPEVIQVEIDSTIKREEIDDSLFKMAFMTEINDEAKGDFWKIMEKHENYY
jgi:hypothetical protein